MKGGKLGAIKAEETKNRQQINYDFPQTQNYESIQEITTSPQEYQKISYQTYEQSNVIDSYNNYDSSNQLNTYDTTNNYEQYTNVSDINGISQTYTPENYDSQILMIIIQIINNQRIIKLIIILHTKIII